MSIRKVDGLICLGLFGIAIGLSACDDENKYSSQQVADQTRALLAKVGNQSARKYILKVEELALPCVSVRQIEDIKKTGQILPAFNTCKGELSAALGAEFSDLDVRDLLAIFSTIVSSRVATYGVGRAHIDGNDIDDLLRSEELNCSTFMLLTGQFFGEKNRQLFYFPEGKTRREPILLDPTTGIVARTSFDSLFRGEPVNRKNVRLFAIKSDGLDGLRKTVLDAILNGKYRPSDFLYLFRSVYEIRTEGSALKYFYSPGGIALRERQEAIKQVQDAKDSKK
jgi:hypothetical protein